MTTLIGFLFAASSGCLGWFPWKAWRRYPKLRAATVLLSIGTTAVVLAGGFLSPRSQYRVEPNHGLPTGPRELSLGPTYKPVWTFVALGVTVICAGIIAASSNKIQTHSALMRGAVVLATITTVAALVVAQNVRWAEPRMTTGKPQPCIAPPPTMCM